MFSSIFWPIQLDKVQDKSALTEGKHDVLCHFYFVACSTTLLHCHSTDSQSSWEKVGINNAQYNLI